MTTSTAPGQLLGSVLSLARQASKAILDVYFTSFKVDIKYLRLAMIDPDNGVVMEDSRSMKPTSNALSCLRIGLIRM